MHIAETNKLVVTESKDAEGYTFDADTGLSGAVLKHGMPGADLGIVIQINLTYFMQ